MAVVSPGVDVGFINDARQKFVASSAYLDDRPAAPLRFLAEANLTLMVRRQEDQVDREEARDELQDRIRAVFQGATFELVTFAAGPGDGGDHVGAGRPGLGPTAPARGPGRAGAGSRPRVRPRGGSTAGGFICDAKLASYVRIVAGRRIVTASGAPVAKPNVLVQFCQVNADSSDVDVNGKPSAFTKSIGSGRVVLFRDGKRIEGTWSRPGIGAPTTFTDAAGRPLLFAPGGTIVALVRNGAPA